MHIKGAIAGVLLTVCNGYVIAGTNQSNSQPTSIDRMFVQKGDVTGDGFPETIEFHVTGESMSTPFKWSVRIKDGKEKVIYSVDRDDTWMDKFFNDDGYEMGCSGYVQCKEKYYFEDIPSSIFLSLKPQDSPYELDEFAQRNLRDTATRYLQSHGVQSQFITQALEEIRRILTRGHYYRLVIPVSAVQDAAPMVWVTGVNMFVPYYQE